MKPVVFTLRSHIEYWDAIEYYERNASIRVADHFKSNVKSASRMIGQFPYLYGKVGKRHRAAPVKRFPYVLVYRVRRDRIEVVSIHPVRKARISI